jgi:hypothetical protein
MHLSTFDFLKSPSDRITQLMIDGDDIFLENQTSSCDRPEDLA